MITGRAVTVAAAFAAEQPAMLPLPAEPFDPARLLACKRSFDVTLRDSSTSLGMTD